MRVNIQINILWLSILHYLKYILKLRVERILSTTFESKVIYNLLYKILGLYYPKLSCYDYKFFLEVLQGRKKVS